MELIRLYPNWTVGIGISPQSGVYIDLPYEILNLLKSSILHRGTLCDLYGTYFSRGIELTWIIWGYIKSIRWIIRGYNTNQNTLTILWPSSYSCHQC